MSNEFSASREALESYDTIIVAFSGGKDSLACLLDLLDRGVSKSRIELWHHDIDGREGSTLMDWACTRDYCCKIAEALGVRLYYSWKVGGFEREMLRDHARTAPTAFEGPEGVQYVGGDRGGENTRRQFPQVSADLSVRWCSSYLKIDVCAAAIRNQDRFIGKRVLVVTGERAEESPGRAKYETFETDRADLRDGKRRPATSTTGAPFTGGPRSASGRSSGATASRRTRRTASAGGASAAPPASSAAPTSGPRCGKSTPHSSTRSPATRRSSARASSAS